jgi:SAM-dependent methyltransferase
VDLQLLTIYRFLVLHLESWRGRVLDVGAGEAPWRELMREVEYVAVDVDSADAFGMRRKEHVTYYDGKKLPFDDESFDHVLCTEVLEHVPKPESLLDDIKRVLKPGGSLVLTVPWSARLHHLPNDYTRFTRYRLKDMLETAGLSNITVEERGNDIAVIANKLLVMNIRFILPVRKWDMLWGWALALAAAPITAIFMFAAHVALWTGMGSSEDPLGYGVVAVKPHDQTPNHGQRPASAQ